MSDSIVKLTVEEALSRLPGGKTIHTIRPMGEILFGSDWSRERVEGAIRTSDVVEESGPGATEAGHGLAIEDERGPLFIETRTSDMEPRSTRRPRGGAKGQRRNS